ncbi:RES family NAD+ phosphorylase [Microbulbifer sp. ZKSA002]|uniref:RES family NAD+ phosphorylase n=1 Tax=Microbulbifer sp. ZKSA002 TaxID=3243388 RepID=UPI00403A15F6
MTLDECERIFKSALCSKSEAEFYYSIEPLFTEYKILSLDFGRGSIFWRGRKIVDEDYKNIEEIDYPNPKHVKKHGRLNDLGEPCFYISARQETALAEIEAKPGQRVQLAGFRVLDENPVRLVVIGELSNVQKCGYMHFAGVDPDRTISKLLNSIGYEKALIYIYIDKFFANILANPNARENGYIFSRALGKAIHARNKAHGIVYPSVRDKGGFNIAVKPTPSDDSFHNVSCLIIKMGKSREYGLMEFTIEKSAKRIDDNGNFIWLENAHNQVVGFYGMNKEEYEEATRQDNDPNALLNTINLKK